MGRAFRERKRREPECASGAPHVSLDADSNISQEPAGVVVDLAAAERGELPVKLDDLDDGEEDDDLFPQAQFLLIELGLTSGTEDNVFVRTLTQVLNGFRWLTYDSKRKIVTLPAVGGYPPTIALPAAVFKDILRNFAWGTGSLFELVQYVLASRSSHFLEMYLTGSISFETLISEDSDFQNLVDGPIDEMSENLPTVEAWEAIFWSEGPKWSANPIVQRYWYYWDRNKFDFRRILHGLPEEFWKREIFTEDFLNILSRFR